MDAARRRGFSLLELMITIAILAIVFVLSVPQDSSWNVRKSFQNSYKLLMDELSLVKSESLTRAVTTKIKLDNVSGEYQITTYYLDSAVNSCLETGAWTQINITKLQLHKDFTINGSGLGSVCFYRDGSSSGGVYNIFHNSVQAKGDITINVIAATGVLDAVFN